MFEKTWEFWTVFAGMAVYVGSRNAETESTQKRVLKTTISGLLTVGLAPEVAPYVNDSETVAAVLIMGFGLIVLDIGTGLLADKDLIMDLVRKKIGK